AAAGCAPANAGGRTRIEGCRLCPTAADCNDSDACPTEVCAAGVCESQPIEGCGVELCANGVDDDADGAPDCFDSDCANDPACAVEICGDCQDNDGDGLVDYEDPDCCDATDALTLRRMTVRMPHKAGRNSLRMKGRYTTAS